MLCCVASSCLVEAASDSGASWCYWLPRATPPRLVSLKSCKHCFGVCGAYVLLGVLSTVLAPRR
eukprot:10352503-Alexandrium_andersonii.AAC.1